MLLIIAKLFLSIALWIALGESLLFTVNFIGKKLNDKNEKMNETMTITTMLMVAPLFLIVPVVI